MNIKIKKLSENYKAPFKKHENDACYDLTACSRNIVNKSEYGYIEYGLGFAAEIPEGYCALIFPRSSCSDTGLIMSNAVGIIDHGFTNEWKARFKYIPGTKYYDVGDRVCQMMIIPTMQLTFEEVEELSDSDRGLGGFGSTN